MTTHELDRFLQARHEIAITTREIMEKLTAPVPAALGGTMTTLQELMELIAQAEALGAKVTIHMEGRYIDHIEIHNDNDHKRLTIEHAAKLLRGLIAKDGGQ